MPFKISKETVSGLWNGWTSVGMQPVPLTQNSVEARKGILIRCPDNEILPDHGNTATVFVGYHSVTADTESTGGVPLAAGETLIIPIVDPSRVFVVSTDENQLVSWMAI